MWDSSSGVELHLGWIISSTSARVTCFSTTGATGAGGAVGGLGSGDLAVQAFYRRDRYRGDHLEWTLPARRSARYWQSNILSSRLLV